MTDEVGGNKESFFFAGVDKVRGFLKARTPLSLPEEKERSPEEKESMVVDTVRQEIV